MNGFKIFTIVASLILFGLIGIIIVTEPPSQPMDVECFGLERSDMNIKYRRLREADRALVRAMQREMSDYIVQSTLRCRQFDKNGVKIFDAKEWWVAR